MNTYINCIKIKKLTPTAIVPKRQSDGAAGYDLYIDSAEPIKIPPHGTVYARSGLSTREGIRPATCVSVIDSDYRGSVGLPLHNDTDTVKIIEPYSRVAQIVFQKTFTPSLIEVEELAETKRGDSGFGSSGV